MKTDNQIFMSALYFSIFCGFIAYLFGFFISKDWNVFEWHAISRLILSIVTSTAFIISYFTGFWNRDREKEIKKLEDIQNLGTPPKNP